MLTGQYDKNRSGLNLAETTLNTSLSFTSAHFGKLAKWDQTDSVKGVVAPVYAQPLYVNHLNMGGGVYRNVTFVATLGGTLYAFDSDDTTTAHGRLMLTVLGGLAEFERELIRTRTGEGRERAKERGVVMGRKPKLTGHQRREALARRDAGEVLTDIARSYNVSHSTISRLT